MTAGFYKIQDNQMIYAPRIVEGNGYALFAQDKDTYQYPVDGWYWFDSDTDASIINVEPSNQAAYDAASAVFESLSKGKQALWQPVRAAVAEAILAGDMETALEILTTVPALYPDAEEDRNLFLNLFP